MEWASDVDSAEVLGEVECNSVITLPKCFIVIEDPTYE